MHSRIFLFTDIFECWDIPEFIEIIKENIAKKEDLFISNISTNSVNTISISNLYF
jgi:hypothetical protein